MLFFDITKLALEVGILLLHAETDFRYRFTKFKYPV